MAKKIKRKVSTVGASAPASQEVSIDPVDSTLPAARSSFSRRTSSSSAAEFNPDYTYVVNDLKRIGLLAGTFFVVLIVLSFFIR